MTDLRDDIKAAFDRMPHTFGAKRAVKNLEARLFAGERVEELASGSYAGGRASWFSQLSACS
jgi:hypothetical protein